MQLVRRTLWTIAKYYLHGLVFTSIFLAASFLWLVVFIFLAVFLAVYGAFIGIVVALVLLALLAGYANALATRWLWFPIRGGLFNHAVQGAVLLFALLLVNFVLVVGAGSLFPGLWASLLGYAVSTPITGLVGRKVAEAWREATVERPLTVPPPRVPDNPLGLRCPRCGRTRLIVATDRSAFCIDCDRGIRSEALRSVP